MNKLFAYILFLTFSFSAFGLDQITFYHSDFRKNVVATTTEEGELESTAEYTPYGELTSSNSRFGRYFQGRDYWPSDSLINVDRRFYSPELAQFVTTDKMTLKDGVSFFNPYQYSNANPNAFIDDNGDIVDQMLLTNIPLGGGGGPRAANGSAKASLKVDKPKQINVAKWGVPKNVTDKFPSGWSAKANKKGVGTRYQDPKNQGNGVRIDQGNPNHSLSSQKVDHVIVRRNGQVIGRNGKPVQGSIKQNAEQAHISLSEYKNWKSWDAP